MKVSVKNHLLKSVSQVLNECQKIVSILSDVQDDDEFCQDSDLWWDEDDVQYDVSSSCSDFSFISETNLESENVVEKFPCKFWWIPWQGDVKVEGDETKTSLDDEDLDDPKDDDIAKDEEGNRDTKAEGDETNNIFLKIKKETAEFNDPNAIRGASIDYKLKANCYRRKENVENDILQCKVLKFLSTSCPASRYNFNWREERMRKMLPPDLFTLWMNFDLLTSDLKDPQDDVKCSPPVIRYPTIDITKCNIRSIANVPTPQKHPIHGCSDDPNFYNKIVRGEGDESHKQFIKFNRHGPFGVAYGYRTNLGIVPVPDEPVHGYVWQDDGWVLCAVHPPDRRCPVSRKWSLREKG